MDVEKTNILFVENYTVDDFSAPRIIYHQDTVAVDTVHLTIDTTYYSGGFKLLSETPLNFNYNWKLQANDTLAFYFSKFVIKTSSENSCCGNQPYLASYFLDNIKQTESVLRIK